MRSASLDLSRWSSVVDALATVVDLDASAREHGALVRRRGVRSAADLLRLALLYGPGGLSLRASASLATQAGLAEVCDVSLLDRLRNAGDWLAYLLDQLLLHKLQHERPSACGAAAGPGRLRLVLVDGSTLSCPGSAGSDWRLQARYEPARGGFTDLRVTPVTTAEGLRHLRLEPDDLLVQDRGYARVGDCAQARDRAGAFITRIGWHSLTLRQADGAPFDLLGALPEVGAASGAAVAEHAVQIGTGRAAIAARLILARLPPEAVARRHHCLRRKASKSGNRLDPRSLEAAGFLMLVTSLPAEQASAEAVVGLYRLRWQIEMAFKRLKSLGGFAALRADDPRLVRTWLLAHLIAVVLIEADVAQDLEEQDLEEQDLQDPDLAEQDLEAPDGSEGSGSFPLDPAQAAA